MHIYKLRNIIISILMFIFVLLACVLFFSMTNPTYYKSLKFKGTSIAYKQYFFGEQYLYPGHYIDNEMIFEQANMKLAVALCLKYKKKKDPEIGEKIVSIAKKYNCCPSKEYLNIDSLMKYYLREFPMRILIE
jgi:hypothetical protein